MQNELRAPRDGTIDRVGVARGRQHRDRRPARGDRVAGRTRQDRWATKRRRGRAARPRPSTAGARPPAPRPSAAPRAARGVRHHLRAARSTTSTREDALGGTATPTDDLGLPGEYPFTRGVQATMYRSRFWTMRQYAGFATAAETNERFRYLLVARARPACRSPSTCRPRWATTPTPPRRRGRSGRVGVPISSLADMETLFAGIPLGEVSTSMTINATAPILLALYVAAAEKQGVARATVVAAPPRTTSSRSTSPAGPGSTRRGPSMRLVTDVFEFASRELPRWNTISISGYHMREAGATAAQELAFTLADGIAYVEAAVGPRAWPSTTSRPGCRSSSPPGPSCSRRWPSSGPPAGCGPGSCASGSAHRTPVR